MSEPSEYQRFYDFVAEADPALVDAWHFTENNKPGGLSEAVRVSLSAAHTMRVPVEDIKAAIAALRGPMDRNESIVIACAWAIVWAIEGDPTAKDIALKEVNHAD